MKTKLLILSVILTTVLVSCGKKVVPTAEEDFSLYRNHYQFERERYEGAQAGQVIEIVLQFDSTQQNLDITQALNKILDYRAPVYTTTYTRRTLPGYRIQIYRGRDRNEASRARQRSYELIPNANPYMIYKSPTYRVRVGDFLEPYEYKEVLKILKREFPNALPVPDLVNIVVYNEEDGATPPPSYPISNEENQDNKNKE